MKEHNPTTPPCPSAGYIRLIAMITLLCTGSILTIGAVLEPDPSGTGTHTQMKLPACSWMVQKGIPCPACGMTTSVACFMHGKFVQSLKAQAFGVVLSAVLLVAAISASVQLLTAADRLGWFLGRWKFWLVVGILGIVCGWIIKFAIGYSYGIYPTH